MSFATKILILLLTLIPVGCGIGDKGGKSRGKKKSSGRPSNLRPGENKQKNVKNVQLVNKFDASKLQIPPFNRKAQNIPPEMFTENGKERRDPFRNFLLENSGNISNQSDQSLSGEKGGTVLLEDYGLNNLNLTGIIWSAGREKALFSNSRGQPTTVLKGDRISKSKALVKEITHDKVLVELKSDNDESGKIVTFSLERTNMPYQIQYEKLRSDQRGIRIRNRRYGRSKRRRK
ncbi:MAG: pilus assembly protein PilP [Deltaproteobacteria bacterium]|jgi:Tfp pilus assembly protein PilP|nr:pilus assembly protein PilP [Deltaproteobacteria bacterium]